MNCATSEVNDIDKFMIHTAVATNALTLGIWTHVMCVYDGINITVYVNGISSGSTAQTNSVMSLNYTVFSTARDFAGAAFYKGQVDDAQIFNYNLTPVQVRTLYNQSSAVRFGPVTGAPR